MRPVVWTETARQDLLAIVGYIAEDNPTAAERVAARLGDTARRLGRRATGRPGRVAGTYEKSVTGLPYIIAYAIGSPSGGREAVTILHIIHSARHWPREAWPG